MFRQLSHSLATFSLHSQFLVCMSAGILISAAVANAEQPTPPQNLKCGETGFPEAVSTSQ